MGMFKNMDFHLTPAYGRDYKSRAAAEADYHAGKDFILAVTGQYCSKRDFEDMSGEVWIRYNNMRHTFRVH